MRAGYTPVLEEAIETRSALFHVLYCGLLRTRQRFVQAKLPKTGNTEKGFLSLQIRSDSLLVQFNQFEAATYGRSTLLFGSRPFSPLDGPAKTAAVDSVSSLEWTD